MPKFLVDECTGIAVVRFLRAQGHDTLSVVESMPQARDSEILQRAVQEQRIVITNDKDFGDIVYRDRKEHAGIILLRLADDSTATKIRILAAVLAEHVDKLANHFVVATEQNIRVRAQNR